MPTNTNLTVHCRGPLAPHEVLDAYWFAQMLLCRALEVVANARCMSTIGRRLETALGRAICFIADAADGTPEKANGRLICAREAVHRALVHIDALSLRRGVRDVVIEDLRKHAALLLERLKMLEGEPVKMWPASNCLPTVLEEALTDVDGQVVVDVVTALVKVPDTATRGLPEPIVAADYKAPGQASRAGTASRPAGDNGGKPGPTPST